MAGLKVPAAGLCRLSPTIGLDSVEAGKVGDADFGYGYVGKAGPRRR